MIIINKLPTTRWFDFKKIQLESLKQDPMAFALQYKNELLLKKRDWIEHIKNTQKEIKWILFAEENDKLIGKVCAFQTKEDSSNQSATLFGFYVNPKYRGSGIAKKLLNKLELQLIRKGILKLHLFVFKTQNAAIKFYIKNGFKTNGETYINVNNVNRPGLLMEKNISKSKNKILDIGCGKGTNIERLEKVGDVTGIDISSYFIDECKKKYLNSKFICVNAEKTDLPSNYYDYINCTDVIEHVSNVYRLFKEINRVSKKGAILHLEFPNVDSEKLLKTIHKDYFSEVGHKRTLTLKKIIKILNENNFKITNFDQGKFIDIPYLMYFFLNKSKIVSQQGEFVLKNDYDKYTNILIQKIYDENVFENINNCPNYKFLDMISHKLFNLDIISIITTLKQVNFVGSNILPKTFMFDCIKTEASKNTINNINKLYIQNRNKKTKFFNQDQALIDKNLMLINENILLKSELKTIKDSKLYKLWPMYDRIKKLLKHM